jgi:hypothetical protein
MRLYELTEVLKELAESDLSDDADIADHPCSVAVRAIEQCVSDINLLKRVERGEAHKSKRVQMLIGLNYNPEV